MDNEEPREGAVESTTNTVIDEAPDAKPQLGGRRFWLVFLCLLLSVFLSALDLTSVSVALPTIIHDLKGEQFVWVGSAYLLASTAFMPMFGGMASIFGRRPMLISAVVIFMIGSALCGAAQSLNMLIAGRSVQGLGGGGILVMNEIIIADLVPLRLRGPYFALVGVSWAIASAFGPLIAGGLATHGQWRWLFYLNLPLGAVALTCILIFINFRVPQTTIKEKLRQMDWIGNLLIIGSTTACVIALSWGGVQFAWSSANILVPLIVGLAGLAAFVIYEAKWAGEWAVTPVKLMSNRTAISGYLGTFIHALGTVAYIYYFPIYYQACRSASPLISAVDCLPAALVMTFSSLFAGISVRTFQMYRPQIWFGWVLVIAGFGATSAMTSTTPYGVGAVFQIIIGIPLGVIYTTLPYPILSSLDIHHNSRALALYTFSRAFAQTWGVTIGGTVLQNELKRRLPAEFVAALPAGLSLAYGSIPEIKGLSEPLKAEVQKSFGRSLGTVWQVMIGIMAIGTLSSLLMRDIPMHAKTDDKWGFEEEKDKKAKMESSSEEKQVDAIAPESV